MKILSRKLLAYFMAILLIFTVFSGAMFVTSSAEGTDPVFSLEKYSESDTEVVVSLNLTSGEFRYATFEFSYSANITACTSMTKGDVLKNLIADSEDVMSTSNASSAIATIISVSTISEKGVYYLITFSKANTSTIESEDITAVETEVEATITNNISGGSSTTTIELSESAVNLADGETYQLTATLTPESEETVTWTSDDTSIATVADGLVTAVDFGTTTITASLENGAVATCTVTVDTKLKDEIKAEIESESGIIYGTDIFGSTSTAVKELFSNERITVNSTHDKIATGDTITFKNSDGEIYKTITVVVFGDVNCDGIYDGTDSMIVKCLVNGMLTKEQVGDAVYTAADCDHNGVVDESDIALLDEAGVLLSLVPQTKSGEPDTSSVEYEEYVSCISQFTTDNTTEESQEQTIIDLITSIVKTVIEYFINVIAKFVA